MYHIKNNSYVTQTGLMLAKNLGKCDSLILQMSYQYTGGFSILSIEVKSLRGMII
jgi:hypothetical protein